LSGCGAGFPRKPAHHRSTGVAGVTRRAEAQRRRRSLDAGGRGNPLPDPLPGALAGWPRRHLIRARATGSVAKPQRTHGVSFSNRHSQYRVLHCEISSFGSSGKTRGRDVGMAVAWLVWPIVLVVSVVAVSAQTRRSPRPHVHGSPGQHGRVDRPSCAAAARRRRWPPIHC